MRLLSNEEKASLIIIDQDFIYLEKIRDEFTERLAQSNLTEDDIMTKYNNQQYLELSHAAGYSDAQMSINSDLILQMANRLILKYNIDISNPNPIDPGSIVNVVKNIRSNTGNQTAKKASCKYFQYTACLVVAAASSSGCTIGAPACYAAGAYLCYCGFCSGSIVDSICN